MKKGYPLLFLFTGIKVFKMSIDSGKLEFGELLDDSFDFKHITWNIPDVLSLPDFVDYKVQSPSFSFAGATWKIEMYPNGQVYQQSQGSVDIMIERSNYQFEKQHMFFKYCFKNEAEKEMNKYVNDCLFHADCNKWGVIKFVHSNFVKKDFLMKNGSLTIICQIRTKTPSLSSNSTSKVPIPLCGIKALADLKELFLRQENCDVIFKVKGQEFPAHRAILTARSPVFASTFRNDMKEKATGIVEIEDCDPSSFSDFLCFLYSGNVENLSTENVFSLFTTADKYDIQDLRSECMQFMKKNLSISTFCDTITFALQYCEKELLKLSIDFFSKHLHVVIKTVEWQSLLIKNPIQCNELMIKALECNKS